MSGKKTDNSRQKTKKKVSVCFSIPIPLKTKFARFCDSNSINRSDIITRLIEKLLSENQGIELSV